MELLNNHKYLARTNETNGLLKEFTVVDSREDFCAIRNEKLELEFLDAKVVSTWDIIFDFGDFNIAETYVYYFISYEKIINKYSVTKDSVVMDFEIAKDPTCCFNEAKNKIYDDEKKKEEDPQKQIRIRITEMKVISKRPTSTNIFFKNDITYY